MGYTHGDPVRATPEWLKDREEMRFEVRYSPVKGNCYCDWCQEFIPKGSRAAKVGRMVTDDIYRKGEKVKVSREFQRHALLCPDCGGKYERGEL